MGLKIRAVSHGDEWRSKCSFMPDFVKETDKLLSDRSLMRQVNGYQNKGPTSLRCKAFSSPSKEGLYPGNGPFTEAVPAAG